MDTAMGDIEAPPVPADGLGPHLQAGRPDPVEPGQAHLASEELPRLRGESVAFESAADLYPDIRLIFGYWSAKKGDRFAPASHDIDPMEIAPVLPRITLVDALSFGGAPTEADFRYRLAGTNIVHAYGGPLVGKRVRDLEPAAFGELICRHYAEALACRAPVAHRIRLDTRMSRIFYLRATFPLSDDGCTIGQLMTVGCGPANPRSLRDCFRVFG